MADGRQALGWLLLALAGTTATGAVTTAGVARVVLWVATGVFLMLAVLSFLPILRRLRVHLAPKTAHAYLQISDLLDPEWKIRGLDLKDCYIAGPAVLIRGDDCQFLYCTFDGYDLLEPWIFPGMGPIGAIEVVDCTFKNCRFQGVAFAMTEKEALGLAKVLEDSMEATPPEDPPSTTAHEQAPPSSPESSG